MENTLKQISINTLCYKEDLKFLQGYLESLPNGCQINLMYTEGLNVVDTKVESLKELKIDGKIVVTSQKHDGGGELNLFKYTYPKILSANIDKFSFSNAKNELIKVATRDWIINLDVDERMILENDEYKTMSMLKPEVGGIFVTLVSYIYPATNDNEDVKATRQIRIFRNHNGFQFKGTVHEDISQSIITKGFKLLASGILIKHRGYEGQDRIDFLRKLARNNAYLFKDLAIEPNHIYNLNKVLEALKLFKHVKLI